MAREIMNEPIEASSPLFVQEKQTYAQRRERIATAALAGLCALNDQRECPKQRMDDVEAWRAETRTEDAKWCVAMADALMTELDKP